MGSRAMTARHGSLSQVRNPLHVSRTTTFALAARPGGWPASLQAASGPDEGQS
jgi:hypothetical protein